MCATYSSSVNLLKSLPSDSVKLDPRPGCSVWISWEKSTDSSTFRKPFWFIITCLVSEQLPQLTTWKQFQVLVYIWPFVYTVELAFATPQSLSIPDCYYTFFYSCCSIYFLQKTGAAGSATSCGIVRRECNGWGIGRWRRRLRKCSH